MRIVVFCAAITVLFNYSYCYYIISVVRFQVAMDTARMPPTRKFTRNKVNSLLLLLYTTTLESLSIHF